MAIFAVLGLANNALYLGLGYTGLKTVSAGLGGLIVSANPVFTAVLAALVLNEALTWRKVLGLLLGVAGVAFIVWHRISVGTDHLAWHRVHAGVTGIDRDRHHPVQTAGAEGQPVDRQRRPEHRRPASRCCRSRSRFSSVGDIVPSMRLLGAFVFLVFGGSILGLSALVSPVEGVWRDRCQRLSLPDAAARDAVRLPGARRARRIRDLLGIVPVALGIYLVTRPARWPAHRFKEQS